MKRGKPLRYWASALVGVALGALPAMWSRVARGEAQTQRRAAIVARVLSFERSFLERVRGPLDFVIVHQHANELSEACAREWLEGFDVLASARVQGRPLTAVKVVYDTAVLARLAEAGHLDVMIVCSVLDSQAAELSRLARARRVLSVGDSAEAVEKHFSLAVLTVADKLRLFINITTAKHEGVILSSDVLKVAKILR